jgi:hypothetical protein
MYTLLVNAGSIGSAKPGIIIYSSLPQVPNYSTSLTSEQRFVLTQGTNLAYQDTNDGWHLLDMASKHDTHLQGSQPTPIPTIYEVVQVPVPQLSGGNFFDSNNFPNCTLVKPFVTHGAPGVCTNWWKPDGTLTNLSTLLPPTMSPARSV